MQRLLLCVATALLLAAQSARADDDLVLGKKLYVDNCLRCHGAKGGGGVGKRLAGDAAYWDFPIFKRTVMEGTYDENKHMKIMPVGERRASTSRRARSPPMPSCTTFRPI